MSSLNNSTNYLIPSITYTVKVSGGDFTSIADAVSYIAAQKYEPTAVITIQLDDGQWPIYKRIEWFGEFVPHASQVVLRGTTGLQKTFTSISTAGSVGAYTLTLAMASTTGIVAGDAVLIPNNVSGGTKPTAIAGCYPITSVSATGISVDYKARRSSALPSGNVTGTVIILKTVIRCYNSWFINVPSFSTLGDINTLAIVGDYTAANRAIHVNATAKVFMTGGNLGICNFSNFGIYFSNGSRSYIASAYISNIGGYSIWLTYNASVIMNIVSSCAGDHGIANEGGVLTIIVNPTGSGASTGATSNQNSNAGVFTIVGGKTYCAAATEFSFNNNLGINTQSSGYIQANSCISNFNANYSIYTSQNSTCFYAGANTDGSVFAADSTSVNTNA